MKKQIGAAVLLAAMIAGPQAAAWDSQGITVSSWAQAGVAAAYENGAVSEAFDLGADYTRPVTRAQLARMTVDLVIGQQQSTLAELAGQLGIELEMAPLTPEAEKDGVAEAGTEASHQTVGDSAEKIREDQKTVGEENKETGQIQKIVGEQSGETQTAEEMPDEQEEMSGGPDNTGRPAEEEGGLAPGDETQTEPPAEPEAQNPPYGDPLDGGLPYVASGSFSDTRSVYIEAAAKLGIVNGADGLFRPDDLVSRAEAAAMMQRCMGVLGMTEANRQPQRFSDNYAIPRWAVEAVKYISGRTDQSGQPIMGGANGKFSPQGSYTIEQAILSLGRMQSSLQVTEVAAGWRDAPGYDSVTLALTFGGDCTLGRGHDFAYSGSFDEMYDQKGASYFFSGIPEFFDDDLTMVNFEGTLTNATAHAYKTFVFKGRPEYAKVLEAGSIDVVSVANNHSMDYLQRGFDDTVRYLSPYVAVSGYERMPIVTVKGIRIGFASNVGWTFDSAQKRFI